MIAHVPGQNEVLLGDFIPEPGNANQQTLACDSTGANNDAAISHSNIGGRTFESVQFMWQAPNDGDGMVNFRLVI